MEKKFYDLRFAAKQTRPLCFMIRVHQNKFICILNFIHAHYWFKCLEKLIWCFYIMCLSFVFIKTYFRAYYQKYRYFILYVHWIISIHTMLQKYLKYLIFVFEEILKKSFFKLNIIFEKYEFLFKAKFLYHKNGSKGL